MDQDQNQFEDQNQESVPDHSGNTSDNLVNADGKPGKIIEKKKSKKTVWFLVVILILSGGWFGYKVLNPNISGPRINPLNLIPPNSLFILETDQPYRLWSEISKTQLWKILQKDTDLEAYGNQLEKLETSLADFDQALDLLTNRKLYLSSHPYDRGAIDYLFIVDLEGLGVLRSWITRTENVTRRTFKDKIIYEKLDNETKETLYFYFEDNYLVASYTHLLVEGAIIENEKASLSRSLDFIEIRKKTIGEGLVRLYVNYESVYDLMGSQINAESIDPIQDALPFLFSGFYFNVEEEAMLLEGHTNYDESIFTYLDLFKNTGTGKLDIANVIPSATSVYFSFGFDSFSDFYDALSEKIGKDQLLAEEFKTYTEKTEKFLNISIADDFVGWIDDEIALIQIESGEFVAEPVLIFKAKSESLAKTKMEFLNKQIKRKTPVRFKAVDYKGYQINFMSVKGLFNLVLGKLFQRFDRPYYTIIDQYVLFANQPQVLRSIIDDWESRNVLGEVPSFQNFANDLGASHAAMLYVQLPYLEKSADGLLGEETIKILKSKNGLLNHFPQLGFKISPAGKLFKTKLMLSVKEVDIQTETMAANDLMVIDPINYDSLWNIDPGDQIELAEIVLEDLGANKQSENYDAGKPKYEVGIKDGLKHGNYFEYYETGELKVKGKYKNDLKEGTWKYYDQEGDQIKRERYKKGELLNN